MSEQVTNVTTLPKHPELKKWGKRVGIVAAAAAVTTLAFLAVRGSEEEETETSEA